MIIFCPSPQVSLTSFLGLNEGFTWEIIKNKGVG